MSLPKPWAGMGLFALLLSVIVLSLFGSLVAADRALTDADRRAVALDASGAALVAQRELRLLEDLLGDFASQHPPGSGRIPARRPPGGLPLAWIADSATATVWPGTATPRSFGDTTAVAELARQVMADGLARAVVVPGSRGDTASLWLAVPVERGGSRVAGAVAVVSGERLLAGLGGSPERQVSLVLRSGNRIIASHERGRPAHVATVVISYPGDVLQLDVGHVGSGRALRSVLWVLALTALLALAAALWRERRHAISLGSRTAELERLYQEVARSNRMKSEFLANVSHELRTPLNAVVGFVEMLREGVYGELTPRQALPVDRIAASATHLRHLVDRLLDIAKIAAGRLEVHPEPLVLRPFVLNVASEMESLVSERGLALSIAVAATLPRIRTDQTHLRQILINLIGNAVKYTPTGEIAVEARLVGPRVAGVDAPDSGPDTSRPPSDRQPWVALSVRDTGIGIAAVDTERIFDEFEQVNAGARTDSARRGTGLGLAISRRLARLLGGELTVASEPGKGSVFTVWLPVDTAAAGPEPA